MTGKSTTRVQQRRQARRAIKDTDLKAIGSGKIKDVYRSHGSRTLLKPGDSVDLAADGASEVAAADRPMNMAEKSVVVTKRREPQCSDDHILRVLAITSARKIRHLTVAIRRAERARAEAVRAAIEEELR
jgi:hypothetical protein